MVEQGESVGLTRGGIILDGEARRYVIWTVGEGDVTALRLRASGLPFTTAPLRRFPLPVRVVGKVSPAALAALKAVFRRRAEEAKAGRIPFSNPELLDPGIFTTKVGDASRAIRDAMGDGKWWHIPKFLE